ncbi:MAG: protein tyrosine phosphatase (PTP) superfamily phosphohydrolase (DUF442 family) [Planctomycetota bacterium]|jgi:protein tyrosine phosphatase (PTP) superfamily phosphohydrolase (DUF442 family)
MKQFHLSMIIYAALLGLCLASCVTTAPEAMSHSRFRLRSDRFGSMCNVASWNRIWTGGRPSIEDLDLAERRGIRHLVDLRLHTEVKSDGPGASRLDVLEVCTEFGLVCTFAPLGEFGDDLISDEAVDAALRALSQDVPTLVICEDGTRGALLLAIHNVLEEGISIQQACDAAYKVGVTKPEHAAFLRKQVERLREQRVAQ